GGGAERRRANRARADRDGRRARGRSDVEGQGREHLADSNRLTGVEDAHEGRALGGRHVEKIPEKVEVNRVVDAVVRDERVGRGVEAIEAIGRDLADPEEPVVVELYLGG